MGNYPPRVRRDLDVGPRSDSRARWLYEPQPLSTQGMTAGFPHRAGRYRPGGNNVFVPGLLELCMYKKKIMTRGWKLILPGCGGTSTLDPGAALTARWLYKP